MKKIYTYLYSFVKEDFEWKSYSFTFLITAFWIVFNYFVFDIESFLNFHKNTFNGFLYSFIFYFLVYNSVAIPLMFFTTNETYKDYKYWMKLSLLLVVFSFETSYLLRGVRFDSLTSLNEIRYVRKLLLNSSKLVYYTVPFIIIWWLFKDYQHKIGLWGLRFNVKEEVRPFVYMFLVMIPLVFVASFSEDFLDSYPSYKAHKYQQAFGLDNYLLMLFYELIYGIDFLWVEWFFRGALLLGFYHFFGDKVLLPMVVLYASIHFGKPIVETISSCFGGYILGIYALRTKTVWGGFFIHVGIAWLMDGFALLQKTLMDY